MDLGLVGKKVLVTGGTRGIGLSIVRAFAKEGCHVGFCARNKYMINEVIKELIQSDGHIIGQAIDIGKQVLLKKWIEDSAKELNGIDIYVSNVSAQSFSWEKSFQIDMMSCVNGIEAALPFLKKSQGGSIVAIASKAAMLSVPSYKPYSALKAALIHYISSLSRELAPIGARANCVSPGEIYFKGGFWERIKREDPFLYENSLKNNPLGRFGLPEEVAKAVVFLASPAASFISGTNLMVDGAGREYVQF